MTGVTLYVSNGTDNALVVAVALAIVALAIVAVALARRDTRQVFILIVAIHSS